MELEQYVSPGTLLPTKVVKVLANGLMVKFLKIFFGFIHVDHLENNISFYPVDSKLQARVIYSCLNPPFIYLSQVHVDLRPYRPLRQLFSPLAKPSTLYELQGSYINRD
jgi:hypothetical protein